MKTKRHQAQVVSLLPRGPERASVSPVTGHYYLSPSLPWEEPQAACPEIWVSVWQVPSHLWSSAGLDQP